MPRHAIRGARSRGPYRQEQGLRPAGRSTSSIGRPSHPVAGNLREIVVAMREKHPPGTPSRSRAPSRQLDRTSRDVRLGKAVVRGGARGHLLVGAGTRPPCLRRVARLHVCLP